MKRSKQVLIITAVLVLCAGVVVGRLSARLPEAAQHDGRQPSWLADQLSLSSQQRQQMDAIWADVKQNMSKSWDTHHDLDKQRDKAVHDLLTPEQQTAYDNIYKDFWAKRQEQEKQRDELVKSAEERSRALLDDSQKARWDELSKQMHSHHHGPSSQHSPGMRPPGMGPPGMEPDGMGPHGMGGGPSSPSTMEN